MIEDIKAHFEKEYPREGCGIIGIVKGKKQFFPCENVAEGNENFVISSKDYFGFKRKMDIIGIVHSHPDGSSEPSEHDINCCNAIGIPYYIFSYPDMDLTIVEPKKRTAPLIGREYEFGVTDCFEAMRDWLNSEGKNVPPRGPFEDDWWLKDGLDYFNDEVMGEWGFHPIQKSEVTKNDILIFNVFSEKANHCGVYLGNDVFYHHAANRLSCRESLYPEWIKHLTRAYRHET